MVKKKATTLPPMPRQLRALEKIAEANGYKVLEKALGLMWTYHVEKKVIRARRQKGVAKIYRNSGDLCIIHQLRQLFLAIRRGFTDEILLCIIALHDIIEDTEMTRAVLAKLMGDEIAALVDGISKKDRISSQRYYRGIASFIKLIIAKLHDREDNLIDIWVYDLERMKLYVKETEECVLPLIDTLKEEGATNVLDQLEMCFVNIHRQLEFAKHYIGALEKIEELKTQLALKKK